MKVYYHCATPGEAFSAVTRGFRDTFLYVERHGLVVYLPGVPVTDRPPVQGPYCPGEPSWVAVEIDEAELAPHALPPPRGSEGARWWLVPCDELNRRRREPGGLATRPEVWGELRALADAGLEGELVG